MSMTKRWLETELEARLAAEKANCGCYYDMDDKFEVLCPKHEAERRAGEEEYVSANYDRMVF